MSHWTHMGDFMYEPTPGSYSKWMWCPDDVGYPERILNIIERLRHTLEPLNHGPSLVLFTLF